MNITIVTLVLALTSSACAWAANPSPAADCLEPVRLQTIEVNGFWKQQAKRLTEHWLPHCIRQMEQSGRGQEYLNLQALARVQRGGQPDWKYTGAPWSDACVYNTVEAVCLALAVNPDGDAELAAALGVETKPVFVGKDYALDGTAPVTTPQRIGISGNAPWTMSVWVKAAANSASIDTFGFGIVGWGKSSRNAGNFLYHRPEGEAVFGFFSNDDRAPAGESAVNRSIVRLPEPKRKGR